METFPGLGGRLQKLARGMKGYLLAAVCMAATSLHAQAPMISETRPLQDGRHFHGTAVLGNHLYVFGGALESRLAIGDDETESVISAPIGPNGQLGQWRINTPMPQKRTYISNTTIALNDMVYIIGGSDKKLNGVTHNTAIFTKPLPDGTLLPWTTSAPFGNGLNTSAAVSTPGYLHVIGGVSIIDKKRRVVNEVWSNALYSDGSLGQWEPGPPLPMPLWFHQAGVAAGRVYVWGGLRATSTDKIEPVPVVYSCPVLGSGKLGPWRQENSFLPAPFYSAASATAGHYLLSFSGRYTGGTLSGDIWWSYVTPNGLSPWKSIQANIPNRLYHAVAPDYRNGNIYIPGGRPEKKNETPTRRVLFFHLSGEARAQAEKTWQALQVATASSAQARTVADSNAGARALSYIAESQLPPEAVAGFRTLNEARRASVAENKPLVLYFTYRGAQPCLEQNQFLQNAQFSQLIGHASFAWVETTEHPQMVQQYGVYRVPTWIAFDRAGAERDRRVGVLSMPELTDVLRKVVQ